MDWYFNWELSKSFKATWRAWKKYNQNRNDLRGVLDIMQGNLEQGISKLDKIGTGKYHFILRLKT